MPLTLADVAALARESGAPRLSVYAGLALPGEDRRKTATTLKNTVEVARRRLAEAGEPEARARALLAPLEAIAADEEVGRRRKRGMAAFLSTEGARVEWVEAVGAEGVWLDERFRLSPLWPALTEGAPLFALVVSEGGATLYDLEGGEARPVKAPNMPKEFDDILKYKDFKPQTEPKNKAPDGKVYAGHGESGEHEIAEERENYAKAVMNAVEARLGGTGVPLVLIADENLQGLLRRHASYPDLVEQGETRHPDTLDEAGLVEAAREAARPLRGAKRREATERIDQAVGRGEFGSETPSEIVAAAAEGRVDTLVFDPTVAARAEPAEALAAQVDHALALTLATGGAVFADDRAEKPLRALFRY